MLHRSIKPGLTIPAELRRKLLRSCTPIMEETSEVISFRSRPARDSLQGEQIFEAGLRGRTSDRRLDETPPVSCAGGY